DLRRPRRHALALRPADRPLDGERRPAGGARRRRHGRRARLRHLGAPRPRRGGDRADARRTVKGPALGLAWVLVLAASPAYADEIVVHGTRPAGTDLDEALDAARARAIAGTHDDPAQAVLDLPGVAGSGFDSGQLLVWGSAPADTQVFVDGVPIPRLFHGSALRSTVNGDLLGSVTLSPGAYGADYGRGLGGLVRLETAALPPVRARASVSADTLDGSVLAGAAPSDGVRVV